jgi:3-oxoacyl-[acyl-carrier-protein] synthase III
MTAIEAVSVYLPDQAVSIEEIGERIGQTPRQVRVYRRFYGLAEVRVAPEESLAELLAAAAGKMTALKGREQRVRHIAHARTLQTVSPYPRNPLHEARHMLGLEHAAAFTLTEHACAGGLLAVDLVGRLLRGSGDPEALGLVFAGEKTFTRLARYIPDTTYMGEGMAAVLVQPRDTGGDVLRSYASQTRGEFAAGLWMGPESSARFQEVYQETLAETMIEAVTRAGITLEDVRLILPHNVNRHSWRQLCRRIDVPLERVFLDNIPVTGHCFGADSFINFASAEELGMLRPGDHYLMAAVGLGATFSAMVFQH